MKTVQDVRDSGTPKTLAPITACRYCETSIGGYAIEADEELADECDNCNELRSSSFRAGFKAGREAGDVR